MIRAFKRYIALILILTLGMALYPINVFAENIIKEERHVVYHSNSMDNTVNNKDIKELGINVKVEKEGIMIPDLQKVDVEFENFLEVPTLVELVYEKVGTDELFTVTSEVWSGNVVSFEIQYDDVSGVGEYSLKKVIYNIEGDQETYILDENVEDFNYNVLLNQSDENNLKQSDSVFEADMGIAEKSRAELNDGITTFVTRLYQTCLSREPDPTGLEHWSKLLRTKQKTGVEVACNFIFSKEYENKNVDNTAFIRMLYTTFLDREAGEREINNCLTDIADGVTRKYIVRQVANSIEFGNLCKNAGIDQGYFKSNSIFDQNLTVNKFVRRTYNLCLNREPDPVGWEDWVKKLLAKERDGISLIWSFTHSKEFFAKQLNDSEYVEILYKVFMNRSSDNVGKVDWTGKLSKGASRDFVMSGFANSIEFANVCKSYGINQGHMVTNEIRDKHLDVTELVYRLYRICLHRTASGAELNEWVSKAVNKKICGPELLANIIISQEYVGRGTSNEQYAKDLYSSILNREDVGGVQYWTQKLDEGVSREEIFSTFVRSSEVQNLFKKLNLSLNRDGWSYPEAQSSRPVSDGTYMIRTILDSNKVMYVANESTQLGANIEIHISNNISAEKFIFTYISNGYYKISSERSGKVLEVVESQNGGANLLQGTWDGNDKQLWKIIKADANTNYIRSKLGMYIEVADSNNLDKTNIQLGTGNNSNGQRWEVLEVEYYSIMGTTSSNLSQMVNYYNGNQKYPDFYKNTDAPTIEEFCKIYLEESAAEGVKAEVAFAQAMNETGFLRFTGDVSITQFNFAGLGATGNGAPGNSFPNVRTGVRAQIQHIKAYASTESLNNECVDNRFGYVKRGSAIYLEWLGQKENPSYAGWAVSKNYGYTLKDKYMNKLLTY